MPDSTRRPKLVIPGHAAWTTDVQLHIGNPTLRIEIPGSRSRAPRNDIPYSFTPALATPPALRISSTTVSAGISDPPVPSRAPPKSLTTTLAPRLASPSAYAPQTIARAGDDGDTFIKN
jgi:hypothetical protein